MTRKILMILLAVVLALSVGLIGCTTPAQQEEEEEEETGTLKIGATFPLSGPGSMWGVYDSQTLQAYASVINKDGGVVIGDTRYTIELFIEDDEMTAEGASRAVSKLLDVYEVDALLTNFETEVVVVVNQAAADRNKVCVSSIVYTPGEEVLGPEWPTSFGVFKNTGVYYDNYFNALVREGVIESTVVATFWADFGLPRWVMGRFKEMNEQWEQEYGYKQVYWELFPPPTMDFTPWLLEVAALPDKVDTIVGDMPMPHLAMLSKQGYEINPEWSYVVPAYLTNVEEFVAMTGYDAAQRCYASMGYPWDFQEAFGDVPPEYVDMAIRVNEEHKAKFGEEITFDGSFMFGANMLVVYLEGCQRAGSIETDAVVRALETATDLKHFYGTSDVSGEETFGLKRFFAFEHAIVGKVEGYEMVPVALVELGPMP